jgi:DNA polymerase-3 subunit beta
MTLEGERMTVRAKKSRFTLSTLPATEFPTVEEINATQTWRYRWGAAAAAREDALLDGPAGCRYYLNGMLWKRRLKCFDLSRLTAIVSHCAKLTCRGRVAGQQVIVPRKGVLELQRILSHDAVTPRFRRKQPFSRPDRRSSPYLES